MAVGRDFKRELPACQSRGLRPDRNLRMRVSREGGMKLTVKQSMMHDCHFRSRGEWDEAVLLESERQAGRVKVWQFEKHVQLVVRGKTIAEIWPDFLVEYPNGQVKVFEVKGAQFFKTREWSIKRKLFEALFPHIEYVVRNKFWKKR